MKPWFGICTLALLGCGGDDGPFVEPMIVRPTATLNEAGVEGSFILDLYLAPEASGESEVTLHQLANQQQNSPAFSVASETEFPVVIEPGEFLRVPMTFSMQVPGCPTALMGTIFDSLKGAVTPITVPSFTSCL